MIKDNNIIFGYGTLIISGDMLTKKLEIKSIRPPKEVGSHPSKNEYVVDQLISLEYGKDFKVLYKEIEKITTDNNILIFRDYKLDFSNYNIKSVQALRNQLHNILYGMQMCYAC